MKKKTYHHAVFWTVLLAFSLMLTGKAIACFAPSAMEMSQGKSMDCCMERCRMETTHEAAQKACEESRLAFSPKEMLSSPDKNCDHTTATMLSDFNPLPLFPSPLFEPNDWINRIQRVQNDAPIKRHASSVPIYTSIQTFLI